MLRVIITLLLLCFAASAQYMGGGGGSAAIACVGTPGDTTGVLRQQCQTAAGAIYACNNSGGCTLAAHWVGVSSDTCPVGTLRFGACEVKTVIPYTDTIFTAASATADKTLFQLPASAKVVAWTIYHTAAYAGTGVTSTTVGVGCSTDAEFYASNFNVFQAAATTTFSDGGGHASCDMAAHNVVARFISNTNFGVGGVTVLTAGSVTIWVRYIPLS